MPTPLRVLILEDVSDEAVILLHHLREAGFDPTWKRVETELAYCDELDQDDPIWQVILADFSLPQFSALRALYLLKARALTIPFIVVTGVINEEVAVECMNRGAADYLLKDRLARLGPAVRRVLEEKRLRDEKRHVEAELRRSETILNTVLGSSSDGVQPQTRHRSLRILMAEDNLVNQKVTLRMLERLGYTADVVVNGREVLEALERSWYDVILMDVQMPEMDGLEATRQVVARYEVLERPRIIAVTANALAGDRQRCLDAGMDDYVSKPVRLKDLDRALRLCLPLEHGLPLRAARPGQQMGLSSPGRRKTAGWNGVT